MSNYLLLNTKNVVQWVLSAALALSANVGNIVFPLFSFFFFKVTPFLKVFNLTALLLHKASGANASDTCLKSWWMYKKQYQTIVELNIVRRSIPSHGFTVPTLIPPDR